MAKWMVAAKRADFDSIGKKYGISPVLARIIRNRDIIEEKDIELFLNGTVSQMHDPFLLKDMEEAVLILQEKIKQKQKIRIIGDYDIDGVCASFILLRGLKELGAVVDVTIPHRMKDGYGLNDDLIEEAANAGVDTILTCDNGIAAEEQIKLANEKKMTVIVTDHHEVPYKETTEGIKFGSEAFPNSLLVQYRKQTCDMQGYKFNLLPPAQAIVNPKREDCTYPYDGICGAMVAYKLVQAMFLRENKNDEQLMKELLCFAAFATVGDVMELKDENRIAVKYGLEWMRNSTNPGLRALIEVNNLTDKPLSAFHIGFVLGPCLNATGRLDTAQRALELFSCTDFGSAVSIAADLKSLNDSRKDMTAKGVEDAVHIVENTDVWKDKVFVLYLPDCHESLAGIIAGRIREKYGKPTFILTKGEEGVKGSGRSIEAYHMFEAMNGCKELFTKFGGHKMAAGLSMEEENIQAFRLYLNEHENLSQEDLEEKIHIDIPMPMSYVTKEFIKELQILEPFGCGNAKPIFAEKNVTFINGTIMGKNKNVGKYKAADENGNHYEVIYFGDLNAFHDFLIQKYTDAAITQLYDGKISGINNSNVINIKITLAYYPTINSYAGRESIQIVMQYYT